MMVDYIDRQVIVSLFPHIKKAWDLSDKQLGSLVSVVSVTVALGALPIALFADRASRVKSIVVMAVIWSLATDLVHVHAQLRPAAGRARRGGRRRGGLRLGRLGADREPLSRFACAARCWRASSPRLRSARCWA